MTEEQAWNIIVAVCQAYSGLNLERALQLKSALSVIHALLAPPKPTASVAVATTETDG